MPHTPRTSRLASVRVNLSRSGIAASVWNCAEGHPCADETVTYYY